MSLTLPISNRVPLSKITPSLAYKDIHCWKLLKRDYTPVNFPAPFQKYERGYTYFQDMKYVKGPKFWTVTEGLHSSAKPYRHGMNSSVIMVLMIIPEGSSYHENRGEYVSNSLKLPVVGKPLSFMPEYLASTVKSGGADTGGGGKPRIKVGDPIWVESLLDEQQSFFKSDYEWRWRMGASLTNEEIKTISKRLDVLKETKVLLNETAIS